MMLLKKSSQDATADGKFHAVLFLSIVYTLPRALLETKGEPGLRTPPSLPLFSMKHITIEIKLIKVLIILQSWLFYIEILCVRVLFFNFF